VTGSRATYWQLARDRLEFGPLPKLMGIVNVTPDSFSDGGQTFEGPAAVDRALQLAAEGADLIDIGGESTRPYSRPVPVGEELRRVVSVVQRVVESTAVPVSIDTAKSRVAGEALAAGAQVVNDITGLTGDPQMIEVVCQYQAGICLMHMQGTPQTMQDAPHYQDVVREVDAYLRERLVELGRLGVAVDRICVDPGIGFGKTHEHNWQLIRHSQAFLQLGAPVLVGHSRKGMLASCIGDKQADRAAATLGVSLALARVGIHVLRVHDVQATRHALLTFAAAGGLDQP
jgi:dihydropteroate synthase